MRHLLTSLSLAVGVVALADQASAKVIKFEVVQIELPAFEGRKFGIGRHL